MTDADQQPIEAADNQDQRPEWLPEKFKTPEALATSYGELERKIGELSERAKQADTLEQNYSELSAQIEQLRTQQQQNPNAADPYITAYQTAMETGDYGTALAVQAQISQLAVQNALQQALPQLESRYQTLDESQSNEIAAYAARSLEGRYGEQFNEAREAMHEIIAANPGLIPEEAKYDPRVAERSLDNVYKLATYGKVATGVDTTQMKEQAQTAQGAGGRVLTPDQQKQEWDQIKAAGERPYWAGLGT